VISLPVNVSEMSGTSAINLPIRNRIASKYFALFLSRNYLSRKGRETGVQIWLSSETGSVGRITLQTKADRATPEWTPYLCLSGFGINANPPRELFRTDPPEGYGVLNTKEDAPESERGIGVAAYGCRDHGLFLHIAFTLRDGSVLAAWSCRNKNTGVGMETLRKMNPGNPLPSLPAADIRLEQIPGIDCLSYAGYHLVSTEKNGIVYEWALYIPNLMPPSRETFFSSRTNIAFSIDDTCFMTFPRSISDDLVIRTEAEYEKWITGGFIELSQNGKASEGMTYAFLTKFTAKLKKALDH
jgi:hypothetical protein